MQSVKISRIVLAEFPWGLQGSSGGHGGRDGGEENQDRAAHSGNWGEFHHFFFHFFFIQGPKKFKRKQEMCSLWMDHNLST